MDRSQKAKKENAMQTRATLAALMAVTVHYHWPEVIPTGHAARVKENLQQLQAQHTTGASTTK